MAKPKPAPLPVDTCIGGYRIVRKISVGGFGVVYLATDKNNAPVAIKEYLPSTLVERDHGELIPRIASEKFKLYSLGLKSFFEEGRALAQLSHPCVVGVLNFFRENETVYMVMDYLYGATLQDFVLTARGLKREKIFHESSIRSLFDDLLNGLRAVHQSRMLHLDIKPANIFINAHNQPILIDFGAARQVLGRQDHMTRPMYTPGFAAPEMLQRTSTLGPWTDIYAIGACIFTCMHGYPPSDAANRSNKDKLGLVLARMRGIYSDNLIELVERCMALDPMNRPQSVFNLQKELMNFSNLRYPERSLGVRIKHNLGKIFS